MDEFIKLLDPGNIPITEYYPDQELEYHVHMHCIISGGGLTSDHKIRKAKGRFFIPVFVLRDKFKGKYLAGLEKLHQDGSLMFSSSCEELRNLCHWKDFRDSLYKKDWCPFIKETFNGFGNAIEYLGTYTHKIAISNSRIISVTQDQVTFSARGKKPDDPPQYHNPVKCQIHPSISDARASAQLSENTLLWISE